MAKEGDILNPMIGVPTRIALFTSSKEAPSSFARFTWNGKPFTICNAASTEMYANS